MKKEKILVLTSLFFMLILGSVHDKRYVLLVISAITFALAYTFNNEVKKIERVYYIAGAIILIPVWLHFVFLWSNLVVISTVADLIHISERAIVGTIGIVIYLLSLYSIGYIIKEIIFAIRKIEIKRVALNKYLLCICIVFVLASSIAIMLKVNFHVDEMMSYGLSNHEEGIEMSFEAGITYDSSEEPFLDYFVVDEDNRFDYSIPYENQVHDVHPPLYYYLLHTICSIFSGTFSKWYAGSLNIFFGILSIVTFFKLVETVEIDNKIIEYTMTGAFALSAGVLNATAFFRMYNLAMFWGLLITLAVMRGLCRSSNSIYYYLILFILVLSAAMTHYYLIVYSASIIIIYGFILLYKKRWKDILGLCLASAFAATYSITLFPRMLYHMFSGYRGEEALENAANSSLTTLIANIRGFGEIISNDLFCNLGIVVLLLVLLSIIFVKDKKKLVPLGAVILYVVIIVKASGAAVQRYFYPIYGVIIFVGVFSIFICIDKLFKEKGSYIFISCVLVITLGGYFINNWGNLFRYSIEMLENADGMQDVDCLYIYSDRWMILPSYEEVSRYESVTFVNSNNLEMLNDLDINSDKELVVLVAGAEIEDVAVDIKNAFQNLSGQYREVGQYGYATTYYFE